MVNDPRINGKESSQRDRRVWPSVIGIDVKGTTCQHNCIRSKSVVKTSLKALCLNARSIRNKVDELNVQDSY